MIDYTWTPQGKKMIADIYEMFNKNGGYFKWKYEALIENSRNAKEISYYKDRITQSMNGQNPNFKRICFISPCDTRNVSWKPCENLLLFVSRGKKSTELLRYLPLRSYTSVNNRRNNFKDYIL